MRKLVRKTVRVLEDTTIFFWVLLIVLTIVGMVSKLAHTSLAWTFELIPYGCAIVMGLLILSYLIRFIYALINATILTIKEKIQ